MVRGIRKIHKHRKRRVELLLKKLEETNAAVGSSRTEKGRRTNRIAGIRRVSFSANCVTL